MRGSNLLRKAVPPSHPLGYGSYNWLRIARQDLGIVIERAALEDLGTKVRQNDHLSSRPRWLADCKARLGKCIAFGIPLQLPEARERASLSEYPLCSPQTLLRSLARSLGPKWRTPVGGREGYHTVDHTHLRTRQGFSNTRVHWGDLDSMGHVNNVTYIRWAESSRIEWARRFALAPAGRDHSKQWNELWTPKGQGLILKSIKMDYKLPLTYPDKVCVLHKLRSLPSPTDTSFMLDVMILSTRHQRIAARGEEEIVMYDYTKMRKTPIPPFMMDAFAKLWADQESLKLEALILTLNIEIRLMLLEKLTWDREGAVEDLGASNGGS